MAGFPMPKVSEQDLPPRDHKVGVQVARWHWQCH
jgi:hypothetical protein